MTQQVMHAQMGGETGGAGDPAAHHAHTLWGGGRRPQHRPTRGGSRPAEDRGLGGNHDPAAGL